MPARRLLSKIHCVKRDLGLDDDSYRDALEVSTGKRSAGLMSDRETIKAIHDLLAGARDPYKPSPEILWKIERMWDEYHHNYCKCSDKTGHKRRWLFSKFKISDMAFLDNRAAYNAVEALKAMKNRQEVGG